jgi:hypoxanthine-guanine phosphoribosyltransferase
MKEIKEHAKKIRQIADEFATKRISILDVASGSAFMVAHLIRLLRLVDAESTTPGSDFMKTLRAAERKAYIWVHSVHQTQAQERWRKHGV